MAPSLFGIRRLDRLVLTALVAVPLLAACDTRPIVGLPGGGAPDGGTGGEGIDDGGYDAGQGGGGASLDGGDAG